MRRIAALLLPVIALLAMAGTAAASAQRANSICVALVVDFGDLGGGVHSTCATVHKGSTGYDVLSAGGHTFGICSNGVLGSIDGKPADGCTKKNDSRHFWSYWHRAPGSSRWTYSTEGAGSYEPANTSTDGWRWMKSPPANVPYASICRSSTRPTPRPRPRATSTRPTPTQQPSPQQTSSRQPAAARHHRPATSHPAASHSVAHHAAAATTPTPAPTTTTEVAPRALTTKTHPPYGAVAGIVAFVALGAAAWWRARRGRSPS